MGLDEALSSLLGHGDGGSLSLLIRCELSFFVNIQLIRGDWYHTLFLGAYINLSFQAHFCIIQCCSCIADLDRAVGGCFVLLLYLLNCDCFSLIDDLLLELVVTSDFGHVVSLIVSVGSCFHLRHHLEWLRSWW